MTTPVPVLKIAQSKQPQNWDGKFGKQRVLHICHIQIISGSVASKIIGVISGCIDMNI